MSSTEIQHQHSAGKRSQPRLHVANLTFGYRDHPLFENFGLSCDANIIVLKGPSGCGKTTLLRILFGSLQAPTDASLPEWRQAALVLQEDALFPWLTGRQNIRRILNNSHADTLEQHALFSLVAGFIDKHAHKMSFGQRRSVELFRAFLSQPALLMLDEPFNYLDDTKAHAFIRHLVDYASADSMVIVTTHRHDHSLDRAAAVFTFAGEPPYSRLEPVS